MVMDMTLNSIIKKLVKNNKSQYTILAMSIIFAVMMIGGYGLIQFSPTVTEVLVAGGSTMMISLTMFGFTLIGTFAFVIYAHALFLKYKSKEIGVFISLGIKRENVKKIVIKELSMVVLIATIIGLILSMPLSYISWKVLTMFIKTAETTYKFGYLGLVIAIIFSIVSMLIMIYITKLYINKVDIIKILKATEEIEDIKGDKYILGLIGIILIPLGIILFTVSSLSKGVLGDISIVFLLIALIGLYLMIVQITSIGMIVKKISPKVYYKNIVFFNLLKLKGNQYTKTLFVSTILVGITIFAISFNSAPIVDSYLTNLDSPYDYMVNVSFQQNGFGEKEIKEIAKNTNTNISNLVNFESISTVTYDEDADYRNAEILVNEEEFNKISNKKIDVKKGKFVNFRNQEEPKLNSEDEQDEYTQGFINGTTQEIVNLSYDYDFYENNIMPPNAHYTHDFIIIDSEDYNKFKADLDERFIVNGYLFNVDNWKESKEFSEYLFESIVKASDNKWCDNYSYSAGFELNKAQNAGNDEYIYEEVNENTVLMAKKWWNFNPYSKYDIHYNSVAEYAIYILLMVYISIIAFVSAIMVIGIKILNTMYQDKSIYKNITFLGSKKSEINKIVSKQVMFIYFTPLVLGTVITLFLYRQMLNVIEIVHINIAFLASCLVSAIVIIIQLIVFFFIKKIAIKEATNFENI